MNKGSGSCRGTSKNNGLKVSCGGPYCLERILWSTECFEISALVIFAPGFLYLICSFGLGWEAKIVRIKLLF